MHCDSTLYLSYASPYVSCFLPLTHWSDPHLDSLDIFLKTTSGKLTSGMSPTQLVHHWVNKERWAVPVDTTRRKAGSCAWEARVQPLQPVQRCRSKSCSYRLLFRTLTKVKGLSSCQIQLSSAFFFSHFFSFSWHLIPPGQEAFPQRHSPCLVSHFSSPPGLIFAHFTTSHVLMGLPQGSDALFLVGQAPQGRNELLSSLITPAKTLLSLLLCSNPYHVHSPVHSGRALEGGCPETERVLPPPCSWRPCTHLHEGAYLSATMAILRGPPLAGRKPLEGFPVANPHGPVCWTSGWTSSSLFTFYPRRKQALIKNMKETFIHSFIQRCSRYWTQGSLPGASSSPCNILLSRGMEAPLHPTPQKLQTTRLWCY